MSEPKSKMTLLLTPAERARLDALRLARGDRHASATLRALVRDAGGDTPSAPDARLAAALDLLAVLPSRAPAAAQPARRGWCAETAAENGADDGEALARGTVQRDGREALERALWGIMPAWGAKAMEDAERRGVPLYLQAAYMRAHTDAARRVLDDPPAPAAAPRRSENTLGLIDLAPGAVLPDPPPAPSTPVHEPDDPGLPGPVEIDVPAARADFLARVGCSPEEYLRRWRAGQIPDTGEGMFRYQRALLLEDTPQDDGADAFLEALHGAAAAAIEAELGHCLPQRPIAGAAELAALIVQALPRWAGLDPGGAPPDPLRPAHVRGAARAARAIADALERIAERA